VIELLVDCGSRPSSPPGEEVAGVQGRELSSSMLRLVGRMPSGHAREPDGEGRVTVTNSWMPLWAGAAWVVVFVAILGVHLRHMVTMRGRARVWHATHVLMALGMIDMAWPADVMPVGSGVGEIVFGAAAIVALSLVAIDIGNGDTPAWLWLIAGVGLAAMVYMFAMTSVRITELSVALAAWFVVEAIGWVSGVFSTLARRVGLGAPLRYATRTVEMTTAGAGRPVVSTVSVPEVPEHDPVRGIPVRLSLAGMSIGMAYMLLAMQFGMSAMQTMTPMPGMLGM
jgi:hypothetical protein